MLLQCGPDGEIRGNQIGNFLQLKTGSASSPSNFVLGVTQEIFEGIPLADQPVNSSSVVQVEALAAHAAGLSNSLDLTSRSNSKYSTGKDAALPIVEDFVKAMAAAFGESFYMPASHMYGRSTMCWQGQVLRYPEAYHLLSDIRKPAYVRLKPGKVSMNNGKVRSAEDRLHNSLKGVWNRVVHPEAPMDKELKKIKNQARAIKRKSDRSSNATDDAKDRVHVEKTNKRANLDAAAFGACILMESDSIIVDPSFDAVLRARRAQVSENARRRAKTVRDVEARLVKAVELGLIEKTAAFDADGLFQELSKVLDMKIGTEGKTLEELFEDHGLYFGFTSLSGAQEVFEKSAFVTDPKRAAAFKHANGDRFNEADFWKIAETHVLFQSYVRAYPARRIETELQTIFFDPRNRLWHNAGSGSYYSSERWLKLFEEEKRICTVFVTYIKLSESKNLQIHSNLPLSCNASSSTKC